MSKLSVFKQLAGLVKARKAYVLVPVLLALLVLAALALLGGVGGGAVLPFVYAFF